MSEQEQAAKSFPNRTREPIPFDNDHRRQVRSLNHQVGLEEWALRLNRKDVRPIGIAFWVYLTTRKANAEGWRAEPKETARTINELADGRFFYPQYWVHLPVKYRESDPDRPGEMRYQSSYIVNPAAFPYYAEAVRQARAFR